jgi:hypothetical protein
MSELCLVAPLHEVYSNNSVLTKVHGVTITKISGYAVCELVAVYHENAKKHFFSKSDVWLTVHRNSVWIRKTN